MHNYVTSPKKILEIANIIKSGDLVIFPTETVYALACSVYAKNTIAKLKLLKLRDIQKPLSILCNNFRQMANLVDTKNYDTLIKEHIPGPVTFILKVKANVDFLNNLQQNTDSLGIRIPNHKLTQDILQLVGTPIVATSVNISGDKPATNLKQVPNQILDNVDYILDEGNADIGEASTVIDLSGKKAKIIRQGPIIIDTND